MSTPCFIAEPFFDPLVEALRYLPECPRLLWNHLPGAGGVKKLGWVGIQHASDSVCGSLNILDLTTLANQTIPLPGRPGFFVETTQPGVVLVGLERRLVFCDLATGQVEETGILITDDPRVIINDGLSIAGGVLFGTKHLEFTKPIAALYFFDPFTRNVRTIMAGQTCSNGKFFRRDVAGVTLIDVDSTPKAINRYRFDEKLERLLDHALVASADSLPGFPDGLLPSPDGLSIIVAFYNPSLVADGIARQLHIDNGEVLCEWRIPGSPRVTNLALVELGGKVKIIFTTAVEGMPAETRRLAPGAGTFFIADTPFGSIPKPPPLFPYGDGHTSSTFGQ
jgi:sugar lactone lactonase YvrE